MLFLIVLESGSPVSECQYGQILVRTEFPVCRKHLLLVTSQGGREEGDLSELTYNAAMNIGFVIARTWKQPRCPSADEWTRKLWYIYTMEYYSAIKKNSFESVLMR